MLIRAGDLDRRIRIERASSTQDPGSGENVETWTALATVWASKRDVSDRERIAAAEVQAEITTRFIIRYSSTVASVNPKDRIIFDGRTYGIEAVKEVGRREGIELTAAARAD
jgi:SPP1 family predicted phage head-tail adaptor